MKKRNRRTAARNPILQKPAREWIGGRFRLPFYIVDPEPVRPDAVIWVDQRSGRILTFEAVDPGAPDSVLLDRLVKALEGPRDNAVRRPTRLRVAEERWAELLRAGLGDELEVRVGPTPEILEVIRRFADEVQPGFNASYLSHRLSPDTVARLLRAAASLYRTAPWKTITHDEYLLALDAPQFGLIGASMSVLGAAGVVYGFVVYESLASFDAIVRQGEELRHFRPGRSELSTPALSVTFNSLTSLPTQMAREIERYGWEIAGPDAYPLAMCFDPDNVLRPATERDCELATACCLALDRLARKLAAGAPFDPVSARETVVVETLADRPSVTVALPLLDRCHPPGCDAQPS
ncbi:MAG: hypothetical protein ACE15E_21035 [Acidobacteriota bacterium]